VAIFGCELSTVMTAYQKLSLTETGRVTFATRMTSMELAGLAEVAELLGVTKRSAQRYVQRADFPDPVARLAATPVWRRGDIEDWKRKTLPLPRDPRTKSN
jgi:predicted DNA-binding transcriptional regulator AlpA